MNMSYNLYQSSEPEYDNDGPRDDKQKISRSRKAIYAKRSRPVVHNGIHRRRNKRFSW